MTEQFEMKSVDDMRALTEEEKLAMTKEAKGPTWYDDNWAPYCMTCSTMMRMTRMDYGFKCHCCGNMIGFDLRRLKESPLNKQ